MNDRTISIGFHTGEDTPYVVTHVMDVIACLYAIDPFRGFIAANVITNSLGYISLNAHLWDMRKKRADPQTGEQANELGLALCDLGNSSNTIDRYNEWKKDETLAGRLETSQHLCQSKRPLLPRRLQRDVTGQLASGVQTKPTMPQDIFGTDCHAPKR